MVAAGGITPIIPLAILSINQTPEFNNDNISKTKNTTCLLVELER
jgi:hypothetical protein